MSRSEVSRICPSLDEAVGAFRTRTFGHATYPYVLLGATYPHIRENTRGQVVSKAVVVATGVTEHGAREILGLDVGDSEDESFWRVPHRPQRPRPVGGAAGGGAPGGGGFRPSG